MMASDHDAFRDSSGLYVLGALAPIERAAFEAHLVRLRRLHDGSRDTARCGECAALRRAAGGATRFAQGSGAECRRPVVEITPWRRNGQSRSIAGSRGTQRGERAARVGREERMAGDGRPGTAGPGARRLRRQPAPADRRVGGAASGSGEPPGDHRTTTGRGEAGGRRGATAVGGTHRARHAAGQSCRSEPGAACRGPRILERQPGAGIRRHRSPAGSGRTHLPVVVSHADRAGERWPVHTRCNRHDCRCLRSAAGWTATDRSGRIIEPDGGVPAPTGPIYLAGTTQ